MSNRSARKDYIKPLILSLAANALFLALFLFAAYYKRDSIKNRAERFVLSRRIERGTAEKVLSAFNREPYAASDGRIEADSDRTVSILFLGNSLTYCGVPDEEEDKTPRGLVSSHIENDYVHLLLKKIADEKNVNIDYSVINIADFERRFTEYPFEKGLLANAGVKNPDYLIVQIGENVSREDITKNGSEFERSYAALLNSFPEAVRIVTLPFWPDKEKIRRITAAAVQTGSFLVDISHLGNGTDAENFACFTKKYKTPGVGVHPGDYGMKNIADCIYTVFANVIE